MKHLLPLVLGLALLAPSEPRASQPPGHLTGDLRLHDFTSRVFGNTRKLRVLLPPDYDAPANRTRRYPVLYLNDGQNLFDPTTSTLNPMEWRVDETVAALVAKNELPPIVVVGIDNAGRRGRFKEYFPWVDEYLSPPEPDPQGTRYPEFLVDEVLPFIESRYRVAREADGRGIGGSSAGALAALYAVARRPGTFGRLLVESPSIYVDDDHVLREAAAVKQWPARIYLGVGTNERGSATCDPHALEDPELVRDVRRLRQVLAGSGVTPDRIELRIAPCAVHDERAWADRLPHALTFLFGVARDAVPSSASRP
jgi:predicted alpha/beta superfamily hydrolase